jgi:hypothetical protein
MGYMRAQYAGYPDDWIWANSLDPLGEAPAGAYSPADLLNRWVEFFFLTNAGTGAAAGFAELVARFEAIRVAGVRIGINVEPGAAANWALGSGAGGTTWSAIFPEIKSRGLLERVYACCARTYLFDQPEFFEPLV